MAKKKLTHLEAAIKAPELVASVILAVRELKTFAADHPVEATQARDLFREYDWILINLMNHPRFREGQQP